MNTPICDKHAFDAQSQDKRYPVRDYLERVVPLEIAEKLETNLRQAREVLKDAHTSLRTFSGADNWTTLDADTLALIVRTLVKLEEIA